MSVKLFLLGSPGSGKSTVARSIESLARDEHWSVERINDYGILREMFVEDQQKGEGRFKPADRGGFDVVDFEAFNEALQKLEQRAKLQISLEEPGQKIVLIEFARNDYQKAFWQFSRDFLHDAYFLYLDTDIEICKQRISRRVANPQTEDDYYVSDYIFQAYYQHDNGQFLTDILLEYGVDEQRANFLRNNGAPQIIEPDIAEFVHFIIDEVIIPAA